MDILLFAIPGKQSEHLFGRSDAYDQRLV